MTPLLASRPRGDRGFERIYRRHAADVYRYAFAVLRNQADAEDVAQTTFMNAYRAYQAGERPRQPHNWLIAIAHNVCRQRFRQSQRRVQEVAYDDTVAETLVADDEKPSAEEIKDALSHLAFNQRAALVMRELEGRSYAEIAEVLEISVSAVETLIFRARRALREQLEGRLTCREAELAISKGLDGRLSRAEKGPLRAHLRQCDECATLARKLRAQRTAIRSLGLVPLPPSLASLFGGGAAGGAAAWGLGGLGGGLAVKAAAGVAAATLVAGGSYEVVREAPWRADDEPPRAASAPEKVTAAHPADGSKTVSVSERSALVTTKPPAHARAAVAARSRPPQTGKAAGRARPEVATKRADGQSVAAAARTKERPAAAPPRTQEGRPSAAEPRGKSAAAETAKPRSASPKRRRPERKDRPPAASTRVDVPSSPRG